MTDLTTRTKPRPNRLPKLSLRGSYIHSAPSSKTRSESAPVLGQGSEPWTETQIHQGGRPMESVKKIHIVSNGGQDLELSVDPDGEAFVAITPAGGRTVDVGLDIDELLSAVTDLKNALR